MKPTITKSHAITICVLVLMFAVPFSAYSQTVWVDDTNTETTVGIEVMIPSLEGNEADSPTGALFIYAHIPLSSNYSLQLDVPVARLGEFDTVVGNPYIGAEYINDMRNFRADLGVRIPVDDDFQAASIIGILANPYAIGSFVPEVTTAVLNLDYRHRTSSNLILRMGGGPSVLFPKYGDTEMVFKYYGQLLYDTGQFRFGGGLLGRAVITEDSESLDERTIHAAGILGSYDFGQINAGAYLRLPLNDTVNDALNYILGLNVSVGF